MLRIGLTGGIGSGKSTVASLLEARGFPVIDADQIARDIIPSVLPQLVEAFGDTILDGDELNRAELARLAFASSEKTKLLNSITHPKIRSETALAFKEAEAAGEEAVIYDMPLLVDQGLHEDMDLVVVVTVEPEARVQRLIRRGLTEADARKRMAAQICDEQRNSAADVLIDNNGLMMDLVPQIDALEERIRNA
ncbi:Dephospho-CoA kinase [Corynebacterium kalinowskii]|uniref:Dephospho-CoA kinase n=1 Tax=Corynebacterium kalinowskii TaxID=2675216 RepID=A0A6B8VSA7_9CORY|nr:dephospho-CoA kinase [Corynebacterium kalinowskii]QGU01885.1 Dephospho-CoA kinase [Corynebacterium kalinowskii]